MISAGDFRNGVTLEIEGQILSDPGVPACKTGKRCRICPHKIKKCYQRRRG